MGKRYFFAERSSMLRILSTRRWWRPPAKGVESQTARISLAVSCEISLAPERQYVRVVVLAAVARRRAIIAQRRAHSRHLVGGDRAADARAIEHDAQPRVSARDRAGNGFGEIGIVHRGRAVGAQIENLVAPIAKYSFSAVLSVRTRRGRRQSRRCERIFRDRRNLRLRWQGLRQRLRCER